MSSASPAPDAVMIDIRGVSIRYGEREILRPTTLQVYAGTIHGIIGPAGSGKTSLLRSINKLSVERDGATVTGAIVVDGNDVLPLRGDELAALRRKVGIVFATPQPLPRTIFENVAYAPRIAGIRDEGVLREMVERALRASQLWDEVADRLDLMATQLSGGQQQRLCIARSLAIKPKVLLMDEPCSALDPTSTRRIEQTIRELVDEVTIVIVTHNMQQAARVSDRCAFFLAEANTPGLIVEHGPTSTMFESPQDPRTADYVNGRFG
jgi:phosphate transport system ATP-binding protein